RRARACDVAARPYRGRARNGARPRRRHRDAAPRQARLGAVCVSGAAQGWVNSRRLTVCSDKTLRHHALEPRNARLGEGHNPRIRYPLRPTAIIDVIEQRRAKRAAEMVPAFAPVEPAPTQRPSPLAKAIKIDAQPSTDPL